MWGVAHNINEEASRCETKEADEPTTHFRVRCLEGTATAQPKQILCRKVGAVLLDLVTLQEKFLNLNSSIKCPILKMFC